MHLQIDSTGKNEILFYDQEQGKDVYSPLLFNIILEVSPSAIGKKNKRHKLETKK